MKKNRSKFTFLSACMAGCMLFSACQLPVLAAQTEAETQVLEEAGAEASAEEPAEEAVAEEEAAAAESTAEEETAAAAETVDTALPAEETAEEAPAEVIPAAAAQAEEASSGEAAQTSVKDHVQRLSFYQDGSSAVLEIYGYRADQWAYPLQNDVNMVLTYSDGSTEKIYLEYGYKALHGDGYRVIATDINNELHGSNYITTTIRIPFSEIREDRGVSVTADKLSAQLSDAPAAEEETGTGELSPYGQNIGGAVDWSVIEVTPLYSSGTNNTDTGYPPRCAWVFSEEKGLIYIYLENVVDWSGSYSTGNFDIVTDTNRTFMFRILDGKVMAGDDNEELEGVVHLGGKNNGSYEIPVPIDRLPAYIKTVSFGYDAEEPTLKGLALTGGAAPADPAAISKDSIDGIYDEWTTYPVDRLDYTTAGTQTATVDGECSLYSDGENIMGHCTSVYNAHTANAYDVATVTLYNRIPQENSWGGYTFGWNGGDLGFKYAKVDENGNMTWLSAGDLQAIKSGTTELYIFGLNAWGNSSHIDNLTAGDTVYGKLFVTVSEDGTKAESEFYVDAAKYAERYGIAPEELRTVASEYIRIGGYTSCAGTSTYPVFGVSLLLGLAGFGFYLNRRERRKAGAEA